MNEEKKEIEEEVILERCDDCGDELPENEINENGICEDCECNYRSCDDCGDRTHEDDQVFADGHSRLICEDCYCKNYFTCGECGEVYHDNEYSRNSLCNNCDIEFEYKDPDFNNRDYCGTRLGSIIKTTRMFGCELEIGGSRELGKQIAEDFKGTGVVSDGSLDEDSQFEVVTPPISAGKGEKYIKDLCKLIQNDDDHYIDYNCGLHIHFDLQSDIVVEDNHVEISDSMDRDTINKLKASLSICKSLLTGYILMQDIFMSFVPESRRSNDYCRYLSDNYQLKEIRGAKTMLELQEIWYRVEGSSSVADEKDENYNDTRYHYMNFHSLFRRGTLEVRLHTGTANSTKILNWANLHGLFIDKIVNDVMSNTNYQYGYMADFINKLNKLKTVSDLRLKTQGLFDMLDIKEESRKYLFKRQDTFRKDVRDNEEN